MIYIRDEFSLLVQRLKEALGGSGTFSPSTPANRGNSPKGLTAPEQSPFVEHDGQTARIFIYGISEYGSQSEDVYVSAGNARIPRRYFIQARE